MIVRYYPILSSPSASALIAVVISSLFFSTTLFNAAISSEVGKNLSIEDMAVSPMASISKSSMPLRISLLSKRERVSE